MHLSRHEDNGRFAKQLKEELLEVMNHTHTVKETRTSEFTRRTSLKPIQRKATVYIHKRGCHNESERSHMESEVSYESL